MSGTSRAVASLLDRYTASEGWHYMTGLQALVRLPIQQRIRDAAAGWNTGGFISGYRGSPLGRYDMELWQVSEELTKHNIVFRPAVNEELAATATWGAQYVGQYPGALVEGVFSLWYGKAPGMDRAMDPIRHANLAGTSRKGGSVILVGEDHGAKSSTLANFSDYNFVSTGIPLLYPANAQDVLDYGLHAIALSRYAGCLTGLKLVTDVVEGGGSVEVSPDRPAVVLPDRESPTHIRIHAPPLEQENLAYGARLTSALEYIRANALNRIVTAGPEARIGIVAAGKAWQDLGQALSSLGIRDGEFAGGTLRLLKIGAVWPLDDVVVREFAMGLQTIVVIEEKRPLLEEQIRSILYGQPAAPKIIGKFQDGRAYDSRATTAAFPNTGETTPAMVSATLARLLRQTYPSGPWELSNSAAFQRRQTDVLRLPSFCAGCPHGRSTQLPEGSRALAGIGCHGMAMMRDPEKTNAISQMGGEGILWLGQAPFTSEKHVFANLGDGTYFHSGSLAIRAAVAAKLTITYKLLHNGFVSMTGGQPIDGEISPERIIDQLLAEGVQRIAVVADEPGNYRDRQAQAGVTVHPRTELDAVQKQMREIEGVSVILYDQSCATERRRLRKRGRWPDPDRRVFINAAVCEGCGDCGKISGCMAIEPLETEYGRKRTINQSSCNKDFSCVEGFCPSFVTVHGARQRRPKSKIDAIDTSGTPLPHPRPFANSYSVLVSGIGGAGVVTIGQTLAVAGHLDGFYSSNLDVTGVAQKYGAVHSHVKLGRQPGDLHATRIADGEADVIVGCDLIVTAGSDTLAKLKRGTGSVLVDPLVTPTGDFSRNTEWTVDAGAMAATIDEAAEGRSRIIDSQGLAIATLGDAIFANMILLGATWQSGAVPISHEAMMRAIELNAVKVAQNKRAFEVGRLAFHDASRLETDVPRTSRAGASAARCESLEEIITDRKQVLTEYANAIYADRYETVVRKIAEAEDHSGYDHGLAQAAARNYFKLLAAKDEWEVARLYAQPDFVRKLRETFEGDLKLRFHLGAWPFGRRDPETGIYRKGEVGGWILPVFKVMARLRFLRGTALDPFRNNAEARLGRTLLKDYEADLALVNAATIARRPKELGELLHLPERIRGYGHVRKRHADAIAEERRSLRLAISQAEEPVHFVPEPASVDA